MKKKVVVIDDKPLIRQSIVQTIDWEKLECEVVAQAEDGIEGKRVIQENKPDILITDIKMPGLSGLDLAEHMQSSQPLSKTILITGYQDFEYAQRAIRLGVADFIVKPISSEELQLAIRSAVKELDERKSQQQQSEAMTQAYSKLEERHQSSIPDLRSKLCADLLGGHVPDDFDHNQALKELGLQFKSYVIMNVRLQQTAAATTAAADAGRGRQSRHANLIEAAQRLKAKREFELIGFSQHGQLIIVCLFPKTLWQREVRMKLLGFCQELAGDIRSQYGSTCRMAVSSVYKSLKELQEAYVETSQLLDAGFFRDDEPFLFPDQSGTQQEVGKFSIIRDLEQFNQLLERTNSEDVIKHLEQFLEQITVYSEGNILVAKGLISEVCLAAARYYFRVTGDEFGVGKSIDQMLEDVYRLSSMREASDYLAAFIKHIKTKLAGNDKEYSLVVKKVVDYINSHFAENISLTAVAEHFSLSPSYLSRLLRTETGINFVDLVYKARIEAAKRLLRDPKHKVNEVGEMVGYKEYAYFYQVFKKLEGISPKEYKNRSKDI